MINCFILHEDLLISSSLANLTPVAVRGVARPHLEGGWPGIVDPRRQDPDGRHRIPTPQRASGYPLWGDGGGGPWPFL